MHSTAKYKLTPIDIIPYNAHYLQYITDDNIRQLVHENAIGSFAWVALQDGRCLGAGGIRRQHNGTALAWMWLSWEIKQRPFFLHREVKKKLALYRKNYKDSVIANVLDSDLVSHRYIKALGGKPFMHMHYYDPEFEDQTVYEIV